MNWGKMLSSRGWATYLTWVPANLSASILPAPQHAAQGEVLLTALLDQSERIYRLLRELERGGIQDDTQMLKLEIMKEDLRTLADKWQGLLR